MSLFHTRKVLFELLELQSRPLNSLYEELKSGPYMNQVDAYVRIRTSA